MRGGGLAVRAAEPIGRGAVRTVAVFVVSGDSPACGAGFSLACERRLYFAVVALIKYFVCSHNVFRPYSLK